MKTILPTLVALVALSGCEKASKEPSAAAEKPRASTPVAAVPVPAAPAPAAAPFTDEELGKLAVYQREMISVSKKALEVGMGAGLRTGGDASKMGKEIQKDDRFKELQAANEAALAKAGLTQADISRLTPVVMPYYARLNALKEAPKQLENTRKQIADAKAAGKTPNPFDTAMEETFAKQADEIQQARAEAEKRFGKAGLAALEKHEKEHLEVIEQQMEAMLGKPKP